MQNSKKNYYVAPSPPTSLISFQGKDDSNIANCHNREHFIGYVLRGGHYE